MEVDTVRDEIVETAGSHEPAEFHKTPRKAAASGWIGSALEYFDFALYGLSTALIFNVLFFSQDDPALATVAAAVAEHGVLVLLLRFGRVGDDRRRQGRGCCCCHWVWVWVWVR